MNGNAKKAQIYFGNKSTEIYMRILFVSSGNHSGSQINPIIKAQGESLKDYNIDLTYYPIRGKGFWGYFKNIFLLHRYLKNHSFEVVHAHYFLSGITASLAGARPLIVSLMGSDIHSNNCSLIKINLMKVFFNWEIIVKSDAMLNIFRRKKGIHVIPNGVDINMFKPLEQNSCIKKLAWNSSMTNILFAANPNRVEKNFSLAQEAFSILRVENKVLYTLNDVPHHLMPYYFNAADVVLLTSLWEGSPNVIKEAMACNRPIVACDVGDLRKLFGKEEGHFIAKNNPEEIAVNLSFAIEYAQLHRETQGRKRIINLGLDSDTISKKIIELYH